MLVRYACRTSDGEAGGVVAVVAVVAEFKVHLDSAAVGEGEGRCQYWYSWAEGQKNPPGADGGLTEAEEYNQPTLSP